MAEHGGGKISFSFILMLPVQSFSQKYLHSLLTQITRISSAIPAHTTGAFRDRHGRRAGMRWTRAALLTRALICGRRSRVVLTPQWLASSSREASFLGATVTTKPDHRGEYEVNR